MKIFLIDIDGVACEHARSICNWVNEKYNINSKVTDIIEWDYNFGPITFVQAVKKCYSDKNFILNMKVTRGFKYFLTQTSKRMEIIFASSREDCARESTILWIKKKFGNYKVEFVKRKYYLEGDYLLDDCGEEVLHAAKRGKFQKCFLIRRPWNIRVKDRISHIHNIYLIKNFREILEILYDKKTKE